METIWVLENVTRKEDFYSRLQTLLLVTSVSLWKKYHPHHKTVLYVDVQTKEFFENFDIIYKFDILHIWDEVRELSYPENIDRVTFWSSPKTKIISETEIPLLVIDHDFLIFRNIDEILDGESVIYSYDELTENFYPNENCKFTKRLTTPIPHVIDRAANVSLFYLPNPEFARKYGKQTLQNHIEYTAMGDDRIGTIYMIHSEQFMLKQWLVRDEIPHKTLSSNVWDCRDIRSTDITNDNGIWDLKESRRVYRHYGVDERRCKNDDKWYNDEMEYLYRCLNSTKLVDIKKFKKVLGKIKKR